MKLKELRLSQHKTQQEMADKLGVSCPSYKNYELGKTVPSAEVLLRIADYFNVSVDYVIGRETNRFIDTSTLSNIQLILINKIKKMNKNDCEELLLNLETKDD